MNTLEHLLREATLALESRVLKTTGAPGCGDVVEGTGFLVAPGIVATCAHVLADHREELPGTVVARTASGRKFELETVPEWYRRERAGGLDLAFLRAPLDAGPHVLLSGVVATGETLWTWGHPAGRFRAGQSALFTAQGASRLRTIDAKGCPLGDDWQPQRVFGTPVGGGYSGSAVLSRRTGAVCGMLFSSKGGSAHLVSAASILSALAQIDQTKAHLARNIRWLEQLDDEQISIGGWNYPGPRLRAYLDAAILVAREHPYPGVVPGTRPPPLSTVYLRQQAQPVSPPSQDGGSTTRAPQSFGASTVVSSGEILERDGGAVVVAGPGGGKSTLLRTGLIALAERWRAGLTGRWIPVLVPAADLALPRLLHEAVADSVAKGLSVAAPAQNWMPQFFNTEPLRGVPWMVMVDGLDEITDPKVRRDLITKLANASTRPGSPYQFIVTTRPLPYGELSEGEISEQPNAGWPAQRYELLPFTTQDLGQFAEQWFAALNLPEPERTATDFTGNLEQRRLTGLARNPLMAAMLCQLYSTDPGRPLPSSRGHLYQSFVDLLHKRQRAAGLHAQTRVALQECGSEALTAAENTLTNLHDLIACAAAAQRLGSTTPALDFIACQPTAARPRTVPVSEWRTFLAESLRSSGLMTMHGEEALFLHETLRDYLAARHHTRDAQARNQTLEELCQTAAHRYSAAFTRFRYSRPPPKTADSYLGFLLDCGRTETTNSVRTVERFLKRLVKRGRVDGSEWIVRQARLGTCLPSSVTQAAADALWRRVVHSNHSLSWLCIQHAKWVLELGDQRGHHLLAYVARHAGRFDDETRLYAARALSELGDRCGVDYLALIARDAHCGNEKRVEAINALVECGDLRARDHLANIARGADIDAQKRVEAAVALAKQSDPRSHDLLANIAEDVTLSSWPRGDAAEALAKLGDPRGLNALASLAVDAFPGDIHHFVWKRVDWAATLAQLGAQRGYDLLILFTDDTNRNDESRVEAAAALAELNDPRGRDLLIRFARDVSLEESARRLAAEQLWPYDPYVCEEGAGDPGS